MSQTAAGGGRTSQCHGSPLGRYLAGALRHPDALARTIHDLHAPHFIARQVHITKPSITSPGVDKMHIGTSWLNGGRYLHTIPLA